MPGLEVLSLEAGVSRASSSGLFADNGLEDAPFSRLSSQEGAACGLAL